MTMLSPRREVGEFKKRYKWMALVVLLSFCVLLMRMVQLQLAQGRDWSDVAVENITKTIQLPATRGLIYDTKGHVIATNRPSYNIYITPRLLELDRSIDRFLDLMAFSDAERERFTRRLSEIPERRRSHQIEMFSDISRDQLAALETHQQELRGVDVLAVPVRTYEYGHLGSHVVGYLNQVNTQDLKGLKAKGYRVRDRIGRTGVEASYESTLRGFRGYRRILVDARGAIQRDSRLTRSDEPTEREPQPGQNLVLAIDMELTRAVERAFRGHPSGAAVVVDVGSGRVRAMFSKPSYDLNEMSGRLSRDRFEELTEDPFRPLIDKTVYESYFPGSTFKPVSALAALEDEVLDPSVRVDCHGYYELGNRRFRCTQAHGEVDMRRSLIQSCNIYFWRLAEQVGLDRLNRIAREFGLGAPTGIGINSESAGFLATRQWYEQRFGRFRVGHTLNAAIGQGNTRATLVQIAIAYAAIANGGALYTPQLIERVVSAEGVVIEEFPPQIRSEVHVRSKNLEYIKDSLYGVVHDPDGTAFDAHVEGGVPVAGKTGTAEVARYRPSDEEDPQRTWYFNRDHAWFAGFAPADDPEVAIVVLVEHGGSGGRTAAPIAIQILQEHLGGRGLTAVSNHPEGSAQLTSTGTR
ncbi:MAG: penicillin-binding protein 2 [Myxococcota bacterium]